ncbi:MAG: glycerol-3-phosphate acyltransferase [Alphaproteobacteria bacterium]|nr:glycerol-3-phosphate acyltransferase [Alphaproteobacteria bacterium]
MPDPLGDISYTWPFWAAAAIGYLLGTIPFGVILTRLAGAGDLRAIGSGNIGATNVLRTGRKGLAAATLVLDAAKAIVPVVLADRWLTPDFALLVGGGAFVGHLFPVWLGFGDRAQARRSLLALAAIVAAFVLAFSDGPIPMALGGLLAAAAAYRGAWGGKGVATGLGALLAISFPVGIAACATWLAAAGLFRYSSLAAVLAFAAAPAFAWYLGEMPRTHTGFALFLALLVVVRHESNLRRLIKGEEPKIGRKRDPAA